MRKRLYCRRDQQHFLFDVFHCLFLPRMPDTPIGYHISCKEQALDTATEAKWSLNIPGSV